ncbi:cytochrome [Streptomyces qinglanensis]|uniref:Cytochrome n=1 Tax=Streptomyces qinglanensis TaxID=943816 RepID=A0A1E7K7C2_9ACTN|nr:cytochrome P450 [Streptomyces qinglanensis]OEU99736.1 cytochrome [Streptomyces qinglanensis]OEV24142.1 cytochrome [Streptomyces nanshensis]
MADRSVLDLSPDTDGIVDLAVLGDDFVRDPYPVYAALRRRGTVHHVRTPEGALGWLVVGHDAARAALNDPRLSKDRANASPEAGTLSISPGTHMLISDPPDHTRLRKLVSRQFTPRRIAALEPRIRELTAGLLDRMLAHPDGRADLVDSLAFPLPIAVICELLGVPDLERERFSAWSDHVLSAAPEEEKRGSAEALGGYLAELLERQRARPGEDLLSLLIRTSDEDGDRLSTGELHGMAWLLLVAGYETTVGLIANGALALLCHPDQLAELRADPALLDGAVEEMLRYDGPVETSTYRFTREPLEIDGTLIPGDGRLVLPVLADADRDPARFPEGDRFDIHRESGGHLAFGHGIHFCLGAPLARLEARIAFRMLLERTERLELDASPAALEWRQGTVLRGVKSVPVRFG